MFYADAARLKRAPQRRFEMKRARAAPLEHAAPRYESCDAAAIDYTMLASAERHGDMRALTSAMRRAHMQARIIPCLMPLAAA